MLLRRSLHRFEKRIYIALPDMGARLRMFEMNLGKDVPHTLTKKDIRELAARTDG